MGLFYKILGVWNSSENFSIHIYGKQLLYLLTLSIIAAWNFPVLHTDPGIIQLESSQNIDQLDAFEDTMKQSPSMLKENEVHLIKSYIPACCVTVTRAKCLRIPDMNGRESSCSSDNAAASN